MRSRINAGKPTPLWDDRPILYEWLEKYMAAFELLNASRQSTAMGQLSQISLSEVMAYFNIYDITSLDEREEYLTMIYALDRVYIDHYSKKSSK